MTDGLAPGVSVIVPTYAGAGRIGHTLASLARQDLDRVSFEIVVVANGPDDGTAQLVRSFRATHADLQLRLITLPEPDLAAAMNIGIAAARREHVTMLDDDDEVSAEYLAGLLAHAAPGVIVHGYVADVRQIGGLPDYDTYINRSLAKAAGRLVHPDDARAALSFNTAKIVSTRLAQTVPWRADLHVAPDVVFWHELTNRYRLAIQVVERAAHVVYYRLVRTGSHSRPTERSWENAVTARLEAMAALRPITSDPSQYLHSVSTGACRALARSVGAHLLTRPDEHPRLVEEVARRGIDDTFWPAFNQNRARDLVIAYVFPPISDTSALVAARRVRNRGSAVDVITHDMTGWRHQDLSGARVVAPYVANTAVIAGKPYFASWRNMVRFSREGLAAAEGWAATQGEYRSVYSRSMWPASHVLGALYKLRHPEVRWDAEFSDPMSRDIHGELRGGERGDDELSQEIELALEAAGFPAPADTTLCEWIEHATYALADEIMFTNEQQRTYMLEHVADPRLRSRILQHSVISHHPVPPADFYRMSPVDYPLDVDRINIGYFGVFYATRGLTEVVEAIERLEESVRSRLSLHVFTADPEALKAELRGRPALEQTIVVNGYLPYLDFLHVTTLFDCLLVNDYRSQGTHTINPYLPAKVSDYRGSGTPIWAVVEPGSILSGQQTAFSSRLGDVEGAVRALSEIVATPSPRR